MQLFQLYFCIVVTLHGSWISKITSSFDLKNPSCQALNNAPVSGPQCTGGLTDLHPVRIRGSY